MIAPWQLLVQRPTARIESMVDLEGAEPLFAVNEGNDISSSDASLVEKKVKNSPVSTSSGVYPPILLLYPHTASPASCWPRGWVRV